MEDWSLDILEALNASQQLDMLRLIGPKYDLDAEQITEMFLGLENFSELNSMLYMHTVIPNLQRLGLITERTRDDWKRLGMLVDRDSSGAPLPIAGF